MTFELLVKNPTIPPEEGVQEVISPVLTQYCTVLFSARPTIPPIQNWEVSFITEKFPLFWQYSIVLFIAYPHKATVPLIYLSVSVNDTFETQSEILLSTATPATVQKKTYSELDTSRLP